MKRCLNVIRSPLDSSFYRKSLKSFISDLHVFTFCSIFVICHKKLFIFHLHNFMFTGMFSKRLTLYCKKSETRIEKMNTISNHYKKNTTWINNRFVCYISWLLYSYQDFFRASVFVLIFNSVIVNKISIVKVDH